MTTPDYYIYTAIDGFPPPIKRTRDGAFLPQTEESPDWLEYLAWVAAGNTPTPSEDD